MVGSPPLRILQCTDVDDISHLSSSAVTLEYFRLITDNFANFKTQNIRAEDFFFFITVLSAFFHAPKRTTATISPPPPQSDQI